MVPAIAWSACCPKRISLAEEQCEIWYAFRDRGRGEQSKVFHKRPCCDVVQVSADRFECLETSML
jgi:hypothetical protein